MQKSLQDLISNFPDQNLAEQNDFLQNLTDAVLFILEKKSRNELLHFFYRLDLPEESIESALNITLPMPRAQKIAQIILQRLNQKYQTRKN